MTGFWLSGRRAARGLVALAALAAGGLAAPPASPAAGVTLEDVIATALGAHPEHALADERVRQSQGALKQAESPFDWSVFADGGLRRVEVPETSGGFLTDDTDTELVVGGTVGVAKQFESGITVKPGVAVFRDSGSESQEVLSETETTPVLSVTVPLIRMWGETPAAMNRSAAELDVDAARNDTAWRRQLVVHDAVVAYWNALAARMRVDIASWVRRRADEIAATVEQLVDRGELAPSAYHDVRARVLNRTQDLDEAQRDYGAARYALAQALGVDPGAADRLPEPTGRFPETLPEIPAGEAAAAAYVSTALGNRPDLKALSARERAESLKLTGARNDDAPHLELDMNLDQVFLRYVMTLGNNAAEGRLMEHAAAAAEARINLDSLMREITTVVRRSLHELHFSRKAYLTAAEASRVVEMIADDVERRSARGEAAHGERLAIAERVADARLRLVDAARAYAAGIARLRLVMSAVPVGDPSTAAAAAQAFRLPPAPAS